jgi:hypothetical protein
MRYFSPTMFVPQYKPSGGRACRPKYWLALMCACFIATACHNGAASKASGAGDEKAEPDREIQLSFSALEDPASEFVVLRDDGEARVVRYDRYRLIVLAIRKGFLPKTDAAGFFAKVATPVFREAMRQKRFGGEGTAEGDLFALSLKPAGGNTGGIADAAPVAVRSLIRDLLSLTRRLSASPLAEAYLRSSPIEPERYEAIRKDGRLRFFEVNELPDDVRPAVSGAANRPDDFQPLSRAEYDRLLKLASHGSDFFIRHKDAGHQLTLFLSARAPLPVEGAPK